MMGKPLLSIVSKITEKLKPDALENVSRCLRNSSYVRWYGITNVITFVYCLLP